MSEEMSGRARADAACAAREAHLGVVLAQAAQAAISAAEFFGPDTDSAAPGLTALPLRPVMPAGSLHSREIVKAVNAAAKDAGLRPASSKPGSATPAVRSVRHASVDMPAVWQHDHEDPAALAWPAIIDVDITAATAGPGARREIVADAADAAQRVAQHGGHRVSELIGFGPSSIQQWPAIQTGRPAARTVAARLTAAAGEDSAGHPMQWFERAFTRLLMEAFDCGVPLNINASCILDSGCRAGTILCDPETGPPALTMCLTAAAGTAEMLAAAAVDVVLFANAVPSGTMEHDWLTTRITNAARGHIEQVATKARTL